MEYELTVIPKEFSVTHSGMELPDSFMCDLSAQAESGVFIFKVTSGEKTIYASVCDFFDSSDLGSEMVFMSNWMMEYLELEFGAMIRIELVEDLHPASYIKIKPSHEVMLDAVDDVEEFFTVYLENFKVLQTRIPYPITRHGRKFYFYIDELKSDGSSEVALSTNVDLVTEFAEPIEKMPRSTLPRLQPQASIIVPADPKQGFQAFTGRGYRLDGQE